MSDVDRHIMKTLDETVRDALAVKALGQMLVERFVRPLAKTRVVEFGSGGADDPELGRKKAVGIEAVERWKKHPPGKVAGGSEHQQRGGLLHHRGLL